MADIQTYINNILNAVYGEEVRTSLVNALEKINADNEKYLTIKQEVVASKDTVVNQVISFDAKHNNALQTITSLLKATSDAVDMQSTLQTITNVATQKKGELDEAVNVATAKISDVIKAQNALEVAINTASQIKEDLTTAGAVGEQIRTDLNSAIEAANLVSEELKKAVSNIDTVAEEQLKKVVDAGTTQIQNIRTVGAEETEKVQQAAAGIVADRQQIQQNKDDTAKLKEDLTGKLDKNQGAENNGKILGIGADGMLVPVDKPSGGTSGEKDYELISEIIISQEVSIIVFKDFPKPIKEYIFYITCPKSEPISIYIQRDFKNLKIGKTVILYNISATDKELDTYVKGEIIAEKVEILENITNKWNGGNLQINYYNTYEDKTQISVGSYAKLSLICTNQFKIPIGTKITLLGK